MSIINDAINNLENRNFVDAKSIFEKAVVEDDSASAAHAGLAICYASEDDLPAAKREIEISASKGETSLLSYIAYGYICDKEGKTKDAEYYFDQAIRLNSNSFYAYFLRGSFYLAHNKVEDAIESLIQAKKIEKKRWATNRNLSIAYLHNKNYSKALREAISYATLKPSTDAVKLLFHSLYPVFPIVFFAIYATGIYAFLSSPFSPRGIAILSIALIVVELARYFVDRKKERLAYIFLTAVAGGWLYYAVLK